MINNNKQFATLATNLVKSKINFKNNSQAFFVYFVNEYNKALTHNTTQFLKVFKVLTDNEQRLLKAWLKTNTNFKQLNVKDMKILTTDKDILKFTCDSIPLWYETRKNESDSEVKILTDDNFLKSIKALVKKYENVNLSLTNKTTLESLTKLI